MSVANQRKVVCNRDLVKKNTWRLFLCVYQDNLSEAMKKLTHTEFKVYVCLLFNKDKYIIDFSPAYIHELSGLNQDTIRKAFNALIEKGFLVKANDKETIYNFYETPQKRMNNEEREIIEPTTGQVYHYTFEKLKNIVGAIEAAKIWQENGGTLYDE